MDNKLYNSLAPDMQTKINAIMKKNPDFYQELVKADQENPGYREELISQMIITEYNKLLGATESDAQIIAQEHVLNKNMEEKGPLTIDTEGPLTIDTEKTKNELMAALQPFQKQKYITLTKTIAGYKLSISKKCIASNFKIGFFRNNCCKTVIGFIKQFNSAILRVYADNQTPKNTPLSYFFEGLNVSIDPNFFNTCENQYNNMSGDVNLFLSLINMERSNFELYQRLWTKQRESIAGIVEDNAAFGGSHKRYSRHRSRRSLRKSHKKLHKTYKKRHNKRCNHSK
jgi:hypothetical protein